MRQASVRSSYAPKGAHALSTLPLQAQHSFVTHPLRLFVQGSSILWRTLRGSLFWKTSAWLRIRDLFHYTAFQSCAYGARRPKNTALAITHEAFRRFNKSCPGLACSRNRLPWGLSSSGFATAEESVYPIPFYQEVAATFQEIFQRIKEQPHLNYHQLRACTGLQPKGQQSRASQWFPNINNLSLGRVLSICEFSHAAAWSDLRIRCPFHTCVSAPFARCQQERNFCIRIHRSINARNVSLMVNRVPGAKNDWADELSRNKLARFARKPEVRLRFTLASLARRGNCATLHPPTARWDERRLAAQGSVATNQEKMTH